MYRFRLPALCSALACVAATTVPALAQIPVYGEFELQARSNLLVNDDGFNLPPGSSFNSITPSISDEGWVAFPVQVVTHDDNPGQSGTGVWRGRNAVGAIVHRHDGGETVSTEIGLNAVGEIAYRLGLGVGNDQVWFYDPVTDSVSQVSLLPLTPTGVSNLSLTDDGIIGYQGLSGSNRFLASTAAFASPPDSVVHLYDNSLDPGSPHNYIYSPAMNNQRVIASKVNTGTGTDYSKEEIRLFHVDGDSEPVAVDTDIDPDSPFAAFDNGLALNDDGVVAVVARLVDGNVRAVYRLGDGAPVEIARVGSGPITEIQSFRPAINNAGLVAFRASDVLGQAVYVGDGKDLVRVIGNGDFIDTDLGEGQLGQHNDDPVFGGAPGINKHGDVVVAAGLHPAGNNQVEWGSGIIVAWAEQGEPQVALSPGSFSLTVPLDGQAGDTLTVSNVGGGNLAWLVETGSACDGGPSTDWLSVGGSGVLGAGEQVEVELAVDAAGLAAGTHETAFCIDSTDNDGGSYSEVVPVPVTLVVDPDLVVDPIFANGFE